MSLPLNGPRLNRFEKMDVIESALRKHTFIHTPLYLEHEERDPDALRFVWHKTTYRVSAALGVEIADRGILTSNNETELFELLLVQEYWLWKEAQAKKEQKRKDDEELTA